ncbi:lytic transglycosylase domain-containing protein [Salmonella enterica]|nr:lytic transglycosylase domain-containing protein [Salmonella enterica]
MELLQEVKQAVIADIEDVRQSRAREHKPVISGDIDKIITYYADKFNVDRRLIFEIIRQESGFNPNATGRQTKYGTAKGLMQLMDMNSQPHGIDPYNPEENVQVGTALFAKLLNKYQDIELALAAYNAGEGAVDKYGGVPPYKETQNYVKKITERLSDENQ